MVRNQSYVDCVIVGYSSDYDLNTKNAFLEAGCTCVEHKPSTALNLTKII